MAKRHQPRTSRRSEAGLAKSLVTVIGGLAVLSGLLQAFRLLYGHDLFLYGDDSRVPIEALPQFDITFLAGQTVYLTELPFWMRLAFAFPGILLTIIYVVSVLSVRRLVVQVARGEPFSRPALRSLAALTLALLGGSLIHLPVSIAVLYTMPSQLARYLRDEGLMWKSTGSGPIDWPVMLLVLGAIASALLAAFSEGARLREEAEGVV